ncbi:T6SS immunity protein Tdi1 domain-containing protein [Pseudoxanthomonas sp. PXM02]|uniref:T6SS immunity protein Tdi1 domain-containing protein n=1 Tax=Pseudoxanthomonas sp. PXM02 TaxID=2769294 RepID=UPI001785BF00|nr:T6SS immunity protein Tdi1 domain-containing protein [Pseudoxanthomonas sp. PXM02]MBD9480065.1 DUF1851 domain-containing protein [Pseudoxanthomonas sp. PXM02]
MNLSDYLIDQQGHDWSTILADWAWLLPTDLTVWMVNRFGDLIFVPEDGTVHFLDIGAGSVTQLAQSREDFSMLVDLWENADNWLLISLTDGCVAAGHMLGPGQCYTFKLAPVFGGQYALDNIAVGDLVVNYSLLAQIHRQIKDLPDGAQIKLVLDA